MRSLYSRAKYHPRLCRWRNRPRDWRGRLRHVQPFHVLTDRRVSAIRADAGLSPVEAGTPAGEVILELFDAVGLERPARTSVLTAEQLNDIIDRLNARSRAA